MNVPCFLMAISLFFSVASAASSAMATTGYSLLLISVKEAVEIKKTNPRTLFVDVRGEQDFKKIHIPNSINVPLHFIKTKDYLQKMHVILVNQGYGQRRLLQQAELLNKKGIETVVLAGGLAAWSQQGENFAGSDPTDHSILHYVDPAVFSVKEFSRYIEISPEKVEGNLHLSFRTEHMPVTSPTDLPALADVIDEPGQTPLASVLLFNRNGEYDLLKGLPGKCQTTLFFLQEGSEGYEKTMIQQRAILQPKSERMRTIGGCKTCPPARRPSENAFSPNSSLF